MAWKSDGSLAERMRALRQRDDLSLLKQEVDPMGMMEAKPQNLQPPQEQAAAAIPGLGGPPKSDAARAYDNVTSTFAQVEGRVVELKSMLDTQRAHNVDGQEISDFERGLVLFGQDLQDLKDSWGALGVKFNHLMAMDASQMAQGGPMQ
tara:strand:- start:2792 stop:3238 length:447 start_codon:yes stop_codon:yes gene_type:complete